MTKAEKIEWLKNATDEEVINQLYWAVSAMSIGSIQMQVEGQEDFELSKAEALKRMKQEETI